MFRVGRKVPGGSWAAAWAGVALLGAGVAVAQEDDESASQTPVRSQEVEAEPATTTSSSSYRLPWVPSAGSNLESHLPSSSQSKTDINQPDSFDLKRSPAGAPTLRGNEDSLGVLYSDRPRSSSQPENPVHLVTKGETLWGICDSEFDDPRLWPRVWSFNPQLQNPHWIYPGDQLRLVPGAAVEPNAGGGRSSFAGGTLGSGNFVGRRALVPDGTVFLRDRGYIDDPEEDVWGRIVGAREERQLLAEGMEVYMIVRPGVDVELGQQMTVFRDVRTPQPVSGARMPPGRIVAFKGTVEVNGWNPETRVARGRLTESLDVIERGAKVGPIGRRFYVVPPDEAEIDLRATVLTSLYPHLLVGQNQVLFIDRGANDGLKPGNRLFVVRRGDAWRRTLVSSTIMARSRIRMDVPERVDVEETPLHGDEEDFPEEVVAQVRVIRAHRFASLVLVTDSDEEIQPGDTVVARKGY